MKGASLSLFTTGLCRCHSSLKDQNIRDLMLLIPAPIFLQDTLDWAPLKRNQKWVFQETNAHISRHYVF